MSEWISVKDRLPGNRSVIVCYKNKNTGVIVVENGFYNFKYEMWYTGQLIYHQDVTHWMAFPDPPKGA